MSEEQQKSYYAIIPANVRYDPDLTPNAKLLYGEITALANEKGFCWATNDYFAKLYKVTPRTITGLINNLRTKNYIRCELVYKPNSKEIEQRRIYITPIEDKFDTYRNNFPEGIEKNMQYPIEKNFQENITYLNNTYFNNTSNKKKKLVKENKFNPYKQRYFENDELNSIFIDFLELRKELKAKNTERAIKSLLKTLSEYDDDTKYKMIENSITNSWKGVFPLKQERGTKPIRQEQVPSWMGKDIKPIPNSPEEQKEIDDLFIEFQDP